MIEPTEADTVRLSDTPEKIGKMVKGTFTGTGTKKILLMAHMDTVYPKGMAAGQPFKIEGDRVYGLGIADARGGLARGRTQGSQQRLVDRRLVDGIVQRLADAHILQRLAGAALDAQSHRHHRHGPAYGADHAGGFEGIDVVHADVAGDIDLPTLLSSLVALSLFFYLGIRAIVSTIYSARKR